MNNKNKQNITEEEFSLKGVIDMHIHGGPDIFPRFADDEEIAIAARSAGMEAILIKNHALSTARSAYFVNKHISGIKVFGGIVLNWSVGGINPKAVRATLEIGGKEVWMPTFDAQNHADYYGAIGTYGVGSGLIVKGGGDSREKGISILKNDRLIDEVKEIVKLVKEYNAIIGTSHLSKKEISILIKYIKEIGGVNVLITHPHEKVVDMDAEILKGLIGDGVYVEISATNFLSDKGPTKIEEHARMIKNIKAENCIIVSDSGIKRVAISPERLKEFSKLLLLEGVSKDELYLMLSKNPRKILNL